MPTIFQLQRAGVRAFARTGAIIPSRFKSTLEPQAATTGQAGSDNFISDRSLALGVAGLAGSAMAFFSNQARQDNADTRRELNENIRATNEATRRDIREDMKTLRDDVDKRFEKVDKQFEKVDARFEKVDERLTGIDGSLKEISASLSASQSRRWW